MKKTILPLSAICILLLLASLSLVGCQEPLSTFSWREIGTSGQPAFENGWTNAGGAYETCAFGRDAMDFVHLKGLASDGSYNIYDPIFTLPEGYRPAGTLLISVYASAGDDDTGWLYIYSNGEIALRDQGTAGGTTAGVSLNGVTFFAEQ